MTPRVEPGISQIRIFWEWFAMNRVRLRPELEDAEMLDELDRRVQALGPLAWEIGPGVKRDYALTLSPGGDVELLATTESCIAEAPDLDGWEFWAAKQSKAWTGSLSFVGSSGDVHIDASKWRYVLLRFPDGTFDIDVVAPELVDQQGCDQQAGVEMALDGVLGEAERMRRIVGIHVVERFEDQNPGTPFMKLADHLGSLNK